MYEVLDGYHARLRNGRVEIDPQGGEIGGELGVLRIGEYTLTLETSRPCAVFTVNQKSEARSVLQLSDGDRCRFSRKVRIFRNGNFHNAGYPENHLGILELEDSGSMCFMKVGLVTQNSRCYLVGQYTNWRPQLFSKNHQVVCPLFHPDWSQAGGWKTLHEVIEQRFSSLAQNLPKLPGGYVSPNDWAEIDDVPLNADEGIVRWFEPFHGVGGYGEIRTARGDAFVQWQMAPQRPGTTLRYLAPGEKVGLRLDTNPHSQAKCKWVAREVVLLSQ